MQARWLMGYSRGQKKSWKVTDRVRPENTSTLHQQDVHYFQFEINSLGAKSILEFGPGASTELFAKLGLQVTTVEHIQKWYEVALERFKDCPNVRVLKGEDEMPFTVTGMGSYEKFDLAFVDAPQGYRPLRRVHKGYEDCSRFNTTLFALQHAPVVLLHDTARPLERGTLNRLNRMGYKIEFIKVPYGMARITHGNESGLNPQSIAEPRGTPAGAVTGQRHVPSRKRPRKRDGGRAREA
jgi:hypothetical protein